MSMTAIVTIVQAKLVGRLDLAGRTVPAGRLRARPWPRSSFSCISKTLLPIRNSPPANRIMSRQDTSRASMSCRNGEVREREDRGRQAEQEREREQEQQIRVPRAAPSPILRACGCCSFGSLPTTIARKMMLSTPSMISIAVSVSRPSRTAASESGSSRDAPRSRAPRPSSAVARPRRRIRRRTARRSPGRGPRSCRRVARCRCDLPSASFWNVMRRTWCHARWSCCRSRS